MTKQRQAKLENNARDGSVTALELDGSGKNQIDSGVPSWIIC